MYFVQTSLLGTHTFFMLFLPLFFFFGAGDAGRSLLYILAAGGYITSVIKDLFCVPRPFSPPLVRLSTGTHGLEYGFPSTHSTNAISMCFFLCALVSRAVADLTQSTIIASLLVFLAASVTFGRIYTGMHSIVDVIVGVAIGYGTFAIHHAYEAHIEAFTLTGGWLGHFFPPSS